MSQEEQIWIFEGRLKKAGDGLEAIRRQIEAGIGATTPTGEQDSSMLEKNSHTPDFATVRWNGKTYQLTPKQRVVVQILWEAMEDMVPAVSGAYLSLAAETGKMSSLFRDTTIIGELIVPGERHDTYRLAPHKF